MAVVDRALVIRRKGNVRSEEYAKQCIDSVQRCHMDFELVDAIENLDHREAAASVGMHVPDGPGSHNNTIFHHPECYEQGNACCTASHVKAWKRIVELDKPCAVLEHDALVVANFQNVEISTDYLFFLGVRLRDPNLYKPASGPRAVMQIPQAIGTHAYAINPDTAKKLLSMYEEHGFIWNVDHLLFMSNECKLPIIAVDPYPTMCWSRESTMMDHSEEKKTPRGVIAGINDQNMFHSMTPAFLEGMGIPIHHQVGK